MCDHTEVSQATSSDWESVCADCGQVVEWVPMVVQDVVTSVVPVRFWFTSGGRSVSRVAVTAMEAWRQIELDNESRPMPSWLRTEVVTVWKKGVALKSQTWDQWHAELVEADRSDADETSECEVCQGTGTVTDRNRQYLDRGTKWERSFDDPCKIECPECSGVGRV